MKKDESDVKDLHKKDEGFSEQVFTKKLTPREKTVFRMKKLLFTGAAIGLAICETSNMGCVMDPPPPPMQCAEGLQARDFYAEGLHWQAQWTTYFRRPAVRVTIGIYSYSRDIISFNEKPSVTGGRLIRARSTANDEFTILFIPDENATSAELSIPVMCDDFGSSLQFTLDVSTPAEAGTGIVINF